MFRLRTSSTGRQLTRRVSTCAWAGMICLSIDCASQTPPTHSEFVDRFRQILATRCGRKTRVETCNGQNHVLRRIVANLGIEVSDGNGFKRSQHGVPSRSQRQKHVMKAGSARYGEQTCWLTAPAHTVSRSLTVRADTMYLHDDARDVLIF